LVLVALRRLTAVTRPVVEHWRALKAWNWHCFESETLCVLAEAFMREGSTVAATSALADAKAHLRDAMACSAQLTRLEAHA
jgi:hypothetical protein